MAYKTKEQAIEHAEQLGKERAYAIYAFQVGREFHVGPILTLERYLDHHGVGAVSVVYQTIPTGYKEAEEDLRRAVIKMFRKGASRRGIVSMVEGVFTDEVLRLRTGMTSPFTRHTDLSQVRILDDIMREVQYLIDQNQPEVS